MKIQGISDGVAHLVFERREDLSGHGNLFNKKSNELHPPLKIITSCEYFDRVNFKLR